MSQGVPNVNTQFSFASIRSGHVLPGNYIGAGAGAPHLAVAATLVVARAIVELALLKPKMAAMSVTAHLTEQFVLKSRFVRLNLKWLIVGAYIPDGWGLDRLFMAFDPGMHRDYGFGWVHSLPVPFLIALPVLFIFGRWPAISFLLSMELHVLTDTFDTLGVKLFWPFSDVKYSLGLYPWHDRGTWIDLYGFFTSLPALLFEGFFLIWAVRVIRENGHGHFFRGLSSFWNSSGWK